MLDTRILFSVLTLVACAPHETATAPPPATAMTTVATASAPSAASVAPFVPTSSPPSAALRPNPCIEVGHEVDLEGIVHLHKNQHPNGTWWTTYILDVSPPRCVEGLPDTTSASEVQIAPSDDKMSRALDKLGEQRIRVTGATFGAMTAWHVRPLVIGAASIAPL